MPIRPGRCAALAPVVGGDEERRPAGGWPDPNGKKGSSSPWSQRRRAVDFRDFLDEIDRQVDPGLAVHVICDNLTLRTRHRPSTGG